MFKPYLGDRGGSAKLSKITMIVLVATMIYVVNGQ